ncbi:hypothetical protein VKT23_020069 [Stygiomarasmius scandens]|uniref:Uncharacterized protein n=1 Tax=Marasmiellus scandens TaxID=2682957 RepID=A0ABR1ILY1_9AGAR
MPRSIRHPSRTLMPYSRSRSENRPTGQIARVPVRLPLQDPPKDVLDFIIQYRSYELPLHVTSRTPERAVKYFLVLDMFPSMRNLLHCPADQLPHAVFVTGSGKFQFQCSKCDVQRVPTDLNPKQLQALKAKFQIWLDHRRELSKQAARKKRFEKTMRELEESFAESDRITERMKKLEKEGKQLEREIEELDARQARHFIMVTRLFDLP